MYKTDIAIEISDKIESPVIIRLVSESNNIESLQVIGKSEAFENGEACVQLLEGCSYEYELKKGYRLETLQGIVKESKISKNAGRITPGIYVGTLTLSILNPHNEKTGTVTLEVRSLKASYRSDYRFMLEYITEFCTDLLMQTSSPVAQSFTPDYNTDSETLYQRFAFVQSVLNSDEFCEAVHRITTAPMTAWSSSERETDIRRIKRLGRSQIRQIASRPNRIRRMDSKK